MTNESKSFDQMMREYYDRAISPRPGLEQSPPKRALTLPILREMVDDAIVDHEDRIDK